MVDVVQMLTRGGNLCRPLFPLINALPGEGERWVRTITKLLNRPIGGLKRSQPPATKHVNDLFIGLKKVCTNFASPALNFFIASRISAWVWRYKLPPLFTPIGEGVPIRYKCVAAVVRTQEEEGVPEHERIGHSWNEKSRKFNRRKDEWLG